MWTKGDSHDDWRVSGRHCSGRRDIVGSIGAAIAGKLGTKIRVKAIECSMAAQKTQRIDACGLGGKIVLLPWHAA
jgi:hypothetical protein